MLLEDIFIILSCQNPTQVYVFSEILEFLKLIKKGISKFLRIREIREEINKFCY